MSTIPAFEAFIDAVIADPSLTKGDAGDIIASFGAGISGPESRDYLDAVAAGYETIGVLNNPTYAALKNEIVNEGKPTSMAMYAALESTVNALPETVPINDGIRITYLRDERDQVDANIVTMVGFRVGQPRQIKEALNLGIDSLRGYKEQVVAELKVLNDV
jgi:hypothetical protein